MANLEGGSIVRLGIESPVYETCGHIIDWTDQPLSQRSMFRCVVRDTRSERTICLVIYIAYLLLFNAAMGYVVLIIVIYQTEFLIAL